MSASRASRAPRGTSLADACVPVAVTDRCGYDESVHHGVAVGLDAGGEMVVAVGDPTVAVYGRSANKPLQADAMVALGLRLDGAELAVACASHGGTDVHVAAVRRILAGAGLGDGDLQNTPDLPLDRRAAERLLAAGGRREPIWMNCSGKHAAMLATCATKGWDGAGYLDRDHPLQAAITERIGELAGEVVHVGVDGCGAPAHVVPLVGLARAVAALAVGRAEVWAAMTEHPDLVGGEGRDVTRLMRHVPGCMAKDGAEGMFVAALPDGRAAAVKIADGNARAGGVVLASILAQLGVPADPSELGEPIRGHGEPVGRVRPVVGAFAGVDR